MVYYGEGDWQYWLNRSLGYDNVKKTETTSRTIERVKVEEEQMKENALKWIVNTKDENVVLVEPHVIQKFYHMMALVDDNEVFAKLIIVPEGGYLVVKDAYIPYQSVMGAHFWSHPDQMSKWMYELTINPDGSKKSLEELDNIFKNMSGHFHSHNSLGTNKSKVTISLDTAPSPSGTDTEDVMEHREGKPYWVEIIGTFKGFSARIATSFPKTITKAKVKVKWWTGIEKTLEEMKDKVFEGSYTQKYNNTGKAWKDRKNNVRESTTTKGVTKEVTSQRNFENWIKIMNEDGLGFKWVHVKNLTDDQRMLYFGDRKYKPPEQEIEVKQTKIDRVGYVEKDIVDEGTLKLYDDAIMIMQGQDAIVEWMKDDPLLLSTNVIPKRVQLIFGNMFEAILSEGEKLFISIGETSYIEYEIWGMDGIFREFLFVRMKDQFNGAYRSMCDMLETFNVSDDLNEVYTDDEMYYKSHRTLTYDDAITIMVMQEIAMEENALKTEDKKENTSIVEVKDMEEPELVIEDLTLDDKGLELIEILNNKIDVIEEKSEKENGENT